MMVLTVAGCIVDVLKARVTDFETAFATRSPLAMLKLTLVIWPPVVIAPEVTPDETKSILVETLIPEVLPVTPPIVTPLRVMVIAPGEMPEAQA